MVANVSYFELKYVQKLIDVQSRFFFEFSNSSPSNTFPNLNLATWQSPFRLRFANQQYMPVFLANDSSSDFHFLIHETCH